MWYQVPFLDNTRSVRKGSELNILAKTWWISMKCACIWRPWTFIRMRDFFRLSIASVDSKQHLSEVVFAISSDFHCTPRVRTTGSNNHQRVLQKCPPWCCAAQVQLTGIWRLHSDNAPADSSHMVQTFWRKTRLLWFAKLLTLLIWLSATSGCSRLKVGYFSNNENPMRALDTTSLKCCYWQVGKNSRMRM